MSVLLRSHVEARQQKLNNVISLNSLDRLVAGDEALVHHIDGDPYCRRRGPLRGPRLQHE